MHVFPNSTKTRQRNQFSNCNLSHYNVNQFQHFGWFCVETVALFLAVFSSSPLHAICVRILSIILVNCLTHNNPGIGIQVFGKVFCYLSLVSSCCIFQFVTLIMIVSLIKYFNVKKKVCLLQQQLHLIVSLKMCRVCMLLTIKYSEKEQQRYRRNILARRQQACFICESMVIQLNRLYSAQCVAL